MKWQYLYKIARYFFRFQVLMQTRHREVSSGGQIECMRRIVDRHGVLGLYKGMQWIETSPKSASAGIVIVSPY